ncbi:hypothetical protein MXD59_21785 [Frankia sp. Ag45/Mut15]|uniref:Uncharacterized protein n=1 Tax=Frankia umida TaxID=573489 RepID=A0ABT0K3H8_9ACTN|nr:hypothetical protein [Frankia umida]MCK9878369.1 hypothetical protein [Frankia umida]
MPEVINGFKIAKLFDGTRDGTPFVSDRPALPAGSERSKLLAYLDGGAVVLRAAGRSVDRLDASRGKSVPIAFHTDGEWVWSASVAYYLEEHELPPEPEFLHYLRSRDFRYVAPAKETIRSASLALESQ